MVKEDSPFMLLGVVDSSFKRPGGGKGEQAEADEAHGLWSGRLPFVAPARSPCFIGQKEFMN